MNNFIDVSPNGQPTAVYDDGNIPDVDLPSGEDSEKPDDTLPDTRPRKGRPGGE